MYKLYRYWVRLNEKDLEEKEADVTFNSNNHTELRPMSENTMYNAVQNQGPACKFAMPISSNLQ